MNALVPAAGDDLTALAEQIRAQVRRAHAGVREAVVAALAAGALLNAAKARIEHGHCEAWLLAHCSLAPRTARAYMRLAEKHPTLSEAERQHIADLPLRDAISAISTPPIAAPRIARILPPRQVWEQERLTTALCAGATALRSLANGVRKNFVDRKKLPGARTKLEAALAAIDELERDVRAMSDAKPAGRPTTALSERRRTS